MSFLNASFCARQAYLTHHRLLHNETYLFSVRMAVLHDDELDLCAGRFRLFSHREREFPVALRRDLPTASETHALVGGMLDWIDEHVEHPWSFDVTSHSVHEASLRFSFADATNAVYFALVWS